jgi:tetratricopeptide (TPR) repeat protein
MIGQTISHYRILEKLGEGGMGVVYRAEDTKLRREVALKFVAPAVVSAAQIKTRLLREAQTAAGLSHPGICTIFEIDEADGQLFLAMEHLDGQTLRERVAASPLGIDEALTVSIQASEALAAAHTDGVVHRDIKPANIMLLPNGQVKILDFGLATTREQTLLTRPGDAPGTLAYMSPEQVRGERATEQSDIWALGVVLFEMLTGRRPFEGEHEQAVLYAILNTTPDRITGLRSGVPLGLEHIVDKALEKVTAHRYQHVDELLADLRRLREELRAGASTPASAPPARLAGGPAPRSSARGPAWGIRLRALLVPTSILAFLAGAFLLFGPAILDDVTVAEPLPIAVISFTNQTGDSTYNYLQEAIPNLLITSLEQSPYLRVITWERMHDLLAQTGRHGAGLIDRDLGFELCRQEGVQTIVLGSYTMAGDVFATDAKVLDVDSKALLESVSSRGRGVGSIIETQIDALSHEIARAVGLSERRVRATQLPVADVTTHSMEAYEQFIEGRQAMHQFYFTEAARHFRRAVTIDSTFAVAHLYLAMTYGYLYDARAEARTYERAKALADRASERERLLIGAQYSLEIEREVEKGLRTLEALAARYPEEKRAYTFLGIHYRRAGRPRDAIQALQRALELDPQYGVALILLAYAYSDVDSLATAIRCVERYTTVVAEDANAYDTLGDFYFMMGRFDDATAAYREALEIKPDFRASARNLAHVAMLRERYDAARHWLEQFTSMTPGAGMISEGVWWDALLDFWSARHETALEKLVRAEELSESVDFAMGKELTLWLRSWSHYECGEFDLCRQVGRDMVQHSEERSSEVTLYRAMHAYCMGLIDLRENDLAASRSRLAELNALGEQTSSDQSRQYYRYLREMLESRYHMARDSLNAALSIARQLAPPDIRAHDSLIDLLANPWTPEDVLARIYVAQGAIDSAIVEYELLTAPNPLHRGFRLVHPIYHFRLAELYEEQGAADSARRAYEKFLEIWGDADEGRSEVAQARARLHALRAGAS